MTNKEIAKLLREVAAAYSIKDEKKYYFQIIAYQRAADNIENSSTEIKDLYDEHKLTELPGIGPTILSHLEELFRTGRVKHFIEIKKEIPESIFPLLSVSKIGPKTALKLVNAFHLHNADTVIEDLEKRAKEGKISELETFGKKSENQILQAIDEYHQDKSKNERMLLPFANEIAEKISNYLKLCPFAKEIEPLGSLRRLVSTIGDIDIAVSSDNPREVINWFVKYPYKERIIEAGDTTASLLTNGGKQVDIMIQPPKSFGALLQHFTGSKAHNIHLRTYAQSKGLSLSEYGIKIKNKIKNSKLKIKNFNSKLNIYQYPTEKEFYEAIGISWIPPEMREDTGEIELAIANHLPKLIELTDIKGDLHVHSSFNIEPSHDLGENSFTDILKKAESLGYEYIGFSEHNPSMNNHNLYQYYNLLARRNRIIEQIQKSTKSIHIFKLLEVDISPDGKLAIDEKSSDLLDGIIIAIHSSFNLDKDVMTKRILKGLSYNKVKILAHPTGRLINKRESYEADWDLIFKFCKEHNIAVEINAWPARLDPPDYLIREGLKIGVKMIINTDSHAKSHLDMMKYGVMLARRGWAKKEDILNTLPYEKFNKWLLQN